MGSDPRRDALIAAARARLGIPYALPPSPPATTDCSYWFGDVCAAAGLPIARWLHGVRTAEQIRAALVPVGWPDVLPGDALFYEHTYEPDEASAVGDGHVASHIGMSLGAGTKRMLNAVAPASRETNIGTAYWQDKLLSAGRLPQLEASVPSTDLPRGVDVASYQGYPDWAAVAASGIAFGFTKLSEGVGYANPTAAHNWTGMRQNGLARGCYHFARPSQNTAEAEADYFAAQFLRLGDQQPGDILVLDLEDTGAGDAGGWALDWLRLVEQRLGWPPIVYTGGWYIDGHNLRAYPALSTYGLWLASYQQPFPAAPAPWEIVAFWQKTDQGQVGGIVGNVDLDVFNGTADRIRLYGKPDGAAPSPPSPPAPAPADPTAQAVALLRQAISLLEA